MTASTGRLLFLGVAGGRWTCVSRCARCVGFFSTFMADELVRSFAASRWRSVRSESRPAFTPATCQLPSGLVEVDALGANVIL